MARALEHIGRMKGGAQAQLMRCSFNMVPGKPLSEGYFVVKFRNNPQGSRILANELLCFKLAHLLNLPVPHAEEVVVGQDLLDASPGLYLEIAGGRTPCAAGRHFGSLFPGDPRETTVFDYVPDETLDELENLRAFCGMLAFDQWTCNTDGRQAVFVRDPSSRKYSVRMIDQGYCFNDGEWTFPDAPLRGLYLRRRVYRGVTGFESFEPWLSRIENLDEHAFDQMMAATPRDWCGGRPQDLDPLIQALIRRRHRVRELLLAVKRSSANPFPRWA